MKKGVIIGIVIVLFLIGAFFVLSKTVFNKSDNNLYQPTPNSNNNPNTNDNVQQIQTFPWKEGGIAISGNYADADIVDLKDGKFRIYYSLEPEVSGFNGQVYSALSSDGINWVQEAGTRKESATFPSVIFLPDGKFRMYFQNAGSIKSAISSDGLKWTDESGTRITTSNNLGLTFNNVLAPTVIQSGDEYIMVYAGAIDEKYQDDTPNSDTHIALWAVSKDGLTFEQKGIALDSRNSELLGFIDGPEFVSWDDGSLKLFFWSYAGVYESEFTGNSFTEPELVYAGKNNNPMQKFPESPPGDPTIIKIGSKWFMYYGQHTKGIYYSTLE